MLIHRRILGSDYATPGLLLAPRGGFSRVELIAELAVIVDGVLLDLRGATAPTSVTHGGGGFDGVSPSVALSRLADGTGRLEIEETTANVVSSTADSNVATFPHALIGAAGQTATSTAPGSIPETDGLRAIYRDLVADIQALGIAMNDIDAWHPHAVLGVRHDVLYWMFRVPAWMVATSSRTWAQRVAWAEAMQKTIASKTALKWYEDIESLSAPTGAMVFVDPDDATVKDISAATALAGTAPTSSQLAAGHWPDTITA